MKKEDVKAKEILGEWQKVARKYCDVDSVSDGEVRKTLNTSYDVK